MHPGNLGHQALAELLAQPLVRAVWEAEAGEAVYTADRRVDPRLPRMPAPMTPDNADATPGFCAMMASGPALPRRSPRPCLQAGHWAGAPHPHARAAHAQHCCCHSRSVPRACPACCAGGVQAGGEEQQRV